MKIKFGFLFSTATDTENTEHHDKTKQSLFKENIPLQQCFTEETIVRNCSRIKILSVEDEMVTFELFSPIMNQYNPELIYTVDGLIRQVCVGIVQLYTNMQ